MPKIFILCAVITEIFANYFQGVAGIPLKYIAAFPLFLIAIANLSSASGKEIKFLSHYLILFLYGLILNFQLDVEFSTSVSDLLPSALFPMMLSLALILCTRTTSRLRFCALSFILCIAVSNIAAFGQYLGIDWMWKVREFASAYSTQFDPLIEAQILERVRAPGFSFFSIHLGYQAILAGMIAVCLHYSSLLTSKRLMVIAACLLLGSFGSQTKSACLGLMILFIGYLYLIGNRFASKVLVIGASALIIWTITSQVSEDTSHQIFRLDQSAINKFSLIELGGRVFSKNLLGIGSGDYLAHAENSITEVESSTEDSFLLSYAPHNYLINMAVKFGILGILVAVLFFFNAATFSHGYQHKRLIYLLQFSYLFYGMTHNNGPLFYDHLTPYFLAVLVNLDVRYHRKSDAASAPLQS